MSDSDSGPEAAELDRTAFFREAALRACSSLEAAKFLHDCFLYVHTVIPASEVFLIRLDPETGGQRGVAMASEVGGRRMDLALDVPSEAAQAADQPSVNFSRVARADAMPAAIPLIASGLLRPDDSLLPLRLTVGSSPVGAIIFAARGSDRYTRRDADLLSLLREPLAAALANSLRYSELVDSRAALAEENGFLRCELRRTLGGGVVGADFGLRPAMELLRRAAAHSSPVVLLGEPGTGKKLLAAALHDLSSRREGPFVVVDCAALLNDELSGGETGERGRCERAHGGSILISRVEALSPAAQARLLGLLRKSEGEAIGLDVRVVATSSRDLSAVVASGVFREDLYQQLSVCAIAIPPLRERQDDIPALVQHLLQKKARELGVSDLPAVDGDDMQRLVAYPWPGNVRELENTIERALIRGGKRLDFAALYVSASVDSSLGASRAEFPTLDEVVADHIRGALACARGKVGGSGGAAELLQVNPSTLRKRMRKLGIPFGRAAAFGLSDSEEAAE